MKKNILKNYGFTILEMTVVIFIIVVGLMGILSLANQNITVVSIDKNTVIASQLAQEGLESVRNKRDFNWILGPGADWEHGTSSGSRSDILPGGISGNGVKIKYTIDAITGTINNNVPAGINDSAAKLYFNAAGFYTHQITPTSTGFSRLITMGNESTASTSVTCQVQWKKGINYYSYYAETVLYNWK